MNEVKKYGWREKTEKESLKTTKSYLEKSYLKENKFCKKNTYKKWASGTVYTVCNI